MNERSYTAEITALRELRPTEDLSLLSAQEARRLFEIETVDPPRASREPSPEEAYRPISAPLMLDPAPTAGEDRSIQPMAPSRTDAFGPAASVEVVREERTDAPAADLSSPRRDWLLQPEPQTVVEPQPYGDDPVRMRELLQWFADGRAATSIIQAPRGAGDLVDVAGEPSERPYQVRWPRSSQRLG
ncbi:hypothetical protein ASG43_00355 [Aureimonas sp. Leaf454]|uniref:hypothetical protein n=1 Tax=Aureimonas sp. Leaf454 TaxID=1736381 RepID=UPI0006FCF1C9|nr:hypothetical protein [Aureimonas sp. Leaf454]KQT54121.1 hypothetical protein ASG43_00355 [Aureimonas sp. Leaf454]